MTTPDGTTPSGTTAAGTTPAGTTASGSPAGPATIRLAASTTEVILAPHNGCRIASLRVGGIELLRQGAKYGCFPMVPFCGRIEHGRFRNGGVEHQMPLNAPPHASHGTGRNVPWRTLHADDRTATFDYDLAEGAGAGATPDASTAPPPGADRNATAPDDATWPYPGTVTQQAALSEDGSSLTLTLGVETAGDSFPAQAGWHPWFRRDLTAPDGTPAGGSARLDFTPAWQEQRGDDHLPTGTRIAPQPGPWDDCFGMPYGVDVTLTWPGALELRVTSRAEWVVVYDEQREAVCVEPQSGPPNGLNTLPRLVTPIEPLEISTTWTWRALD